MTASDRDSDLDALVEQCLDALDRGDREAYERLLEEGGDLADRVRRRVAKLRDAGLLDAAGDGETGEHGARAGDRIGPYRVLQALGRGGMGEVYLAQQESPVRRRVAVKLIKLGMDTREVIRRFEAERQVLAVMDHPGIARVFDAGRTEHGRSYFVMEYVPGEPIIAFCDGKKLSTDERLRLFVNVCEAVQHAHQKGVIHRDLKPTNVLVTVVDDRPRPVVIDFGVAKATHGDLTPGTLYTEVGRVLGTPEYMSPEQAAPDPYDVDTRSDIYSLGVLLHELLIGCLPHDPERMRRAAPSELQRILNEEEPRTPSTRLSDLSAGPEVAEARRTDVPGLTRKLRGDLDWIVLKALEKDRSRRYATALELAQDIERHLTDRPVHAGPPGVGYRLGKFARRYRKSVVATAAFAVVLVAGLVATVLASVSEARAREQLQRSQRHVHLLATVERLRRANEQVGTLAPPWPSNEAELAAWVRDYAEGLPSRLPEIRGAVAELEREIGAADAASAGSGDLELVAFLRDTLAELERDLVAFANPERGPVKHMRDQLDWSRRVEALSELDGEAWRQCCEDVASDPRHHGLRLTPQMGLLPLGRDPSSGLFEFAHLRSGDVPGRPTDGGQLEVDEGTGLVFVLVPAGQFTMGSQADDPAGTNYNPNARASEVPLQRVELRAFFLSKYEMSRAQLLRLGARRDPSQYEIGEQGITAACPVQRLSWADANHVLRDHGLRLPSEAQWEYACRAGTETPWFAGDDPMQLVGYANLADKRHDSQHGVDQAGGVWSEIDDGFTLHAPVFSLRPNPWGFHHMHGNVWEWTSGYYVRYGTPLDLDGDLPRRPTESRRVYRGGSSEMGPAGATSSMRWPGSLDHRRGSVGVRPARAVLPPS